MDFSMRSIVESSLCHDNGNLWTYLMTWQENLCEINQHKRCNISLIFMLEGTILEAYLLSLMVDMVWYQISKNILICTPLLMLFVLIATAGIIILWNSLAVPSIYHVKCVYSIVDIHLHYDFPLFSGSSKDLTGKLKFHSFQYIIPHTCTHYFWNKSLIMGI